MVHCLIINNDTLRLPTDLAPTHYNLSIKVYVPGYVDFPSKLEHTFEANITIHFLVLNVTDKLFKSIEHQEDVQKVIFALSSPLKKGQKYEFHIPYKGFVRKVQKYVQPKGIFYDSYITVKELIDIYYLDCHYHPPKCTTSVSNAATLETIDQGGSWLTSNFDKTPNVFLSVSMEEMLGLEHGVARIYHKSRFFSSSSSHSYEMFEQMFQAPFPLSKLDMVAVRAMHGLNMENWGLLNQQMLLHINWHTNGLETW
uniref:Uncharacterized protein n=1 Tax=Ditylenchus dipsaci TaxID=166011 RepID=A0A915EKF4_9BILA